MEAQDGLEVEELLTHTKDEAGATAVEYGLMVALIAAVILAAVSLIGTNMDAMYSSIANLL